MLDVKAPLIPPHGWLPFVLCMYISMHCLFLLIGCQFLICNCVCVSACVCRMRARAGSCYFPNVTRREVHKHTDFFVCAYAKACLFILVFTAWLVGLFGYLLNICRVLY